MKYLHVELKVCEGCGALWLRKGVTDGVYCTERVARLGDFPAAKGKHAGGRPRLARHTGCCSGRRQGNETQPTAGAR